MQAAAPSHGRTAPGAPAGAAVHFAGFLAALVGYFKARATLAGIEARAAGLHYGVAAGLAVVALFLVTLGYVFLILSIVFAVGAFFEGDGAWIAVMAVAAILHLAGAGVLAALAWRRVGAALFPATLEELEKDQEWLKMLSTKS